VGLTAGGEVTLDSFNWTDTFNGVAVSEGIIPGTGGILISPVTDLAADPTSGTGGIAITQIGGQPVSPVSEPSAILLLLSFVVPVIVLKKRKTPETIPCVCKSIYPLPAGLRITCFGLDRIHLYYLFFVRDDNPRLRARHLLSTTDYTCRERHGEAIYRFNGLPRDGRDGMRPS